MDIHGGGGGGGKRRVMIIAEAGRESQAALDWALSHAVLENDEIILLHVDASNSSRRGGGSGTLSSLLRRPPSATFGSASIGHHSVDCNGEVEFLETMRAACEAKQPRVKVQVERVQLEGKDKANAILLQTKIFSVDLLVIGQRRPSSFLGGKLGGGSSKGSSKSSDTAEWLIENSKCLCVGVQKKGNNMGYLLNTKTHKNFWLLA